jgi:hypothetical protein
MLKLTMCAAAAIVWMLPLRGMAQAEEWCGSSTHDKSVVQCGYTDLTDCENATGKNGMCFVDPEIVLDTKRRPHLASLDPAGRN